MVVYRFTTPLSEADVRQLKAGDQVYLSGVLFGIRDANLIRMFDEPRDPPFDLNGSACIHTAPSVRKVGDRYEPIIVGTTTSTRMNRFTAGLVGQYGVRAIIGKGGLFQDSVDALRELGGVYLAITGGAAALETTQIEAIEDVAWEDLMPEAIWKFRIKELGPLIVAIDSHGNSLYQQVRENAAGRLPDLYKKLGITTALALSLLGLGGCGSSAPADPVAAGREIFMKAQCIGCHAINGQGGTYRMGPDLGKVGSQLSREAMRQMITDPRSRFPGSKMPAYTMSEERLENLLAYLQSLK